VLVSAFLIQSFRTGFADEKALGIFGMLPQSAREFLDQPAEAAYNKKRVPIVSTASSVIAEAVPTAFGRLQQRLWQYDLHPTASSAPSAEEDEKQKALIVRSAPEGMGGVTVDLHPDKETYRARDAEAKHWDELDDEAKIRWKDRLMKAGEWAEAEGEKVLFGVLFSEYAGLVGEGVGQILREL
jgi:hypothetical protein